MAVIAKLLMLAALGFTGFALFRMVESWVQGRNKELIQDVDKEAEHLQELAMAKVRALRDIKDLEFDFETGHIAEDEYQALRKRLERRARAILKRLDELRGDVDYDALIDEELDHRLGVAPNRPAPAAAPVAVAAGPGCGHCAAPLSAEDRFCSECGTPVPEAVGCGGCGAALAEDDRFCSECGEPVAASNVTNAAPERSLAEVQA